jgi:hypothetical protein
LADEHSERGEIAVPGLVHEVHLDRVHLAVHLMLAVHVEVDLEQPEGGAADRHGAARAGLATTV